MNEHPTGFMSQKGLGMPDQPDRRHGPQGTQTVHLQDDLGKRRGKLSPAAAGEFRAGAEGVTGNVLTRTGEPRCEGGVG